VSLVFGRVVLTLLDSAYLAQPSAAPLALSPTWVHAKANRIVAAPFANLQFLGIDHGFLSI
jgi:hypothetical protein